MTHRLAVLPTDNLQLSRGEDLAIPLHIERENCDDSVLFRLENLPAGVRMTDQCRAHRGESSATCRLHAEDNARIVPDQEVHVVASAPGVETARKTIHLAVRERDCDSRKGAGETGRTRYWNDPEAEAEMPTGDQEEEIGAGSADPQGPFEESRYPQENDMPVGEPVPDEPPLQTGGDSNFSC